MLADLLRTVRRPHGLAVRGRLGGRGSSGGRSSLGGLDLVDLAAKFLDGLPTCLARLVNIARVQ